MSDEMQYVNPIIQSMIASAQQGSEKASREQKVEEMKQRAAEFAATNKIAQQHLDLLHQQEEHRAAHEQGLIDIQKAIRDAQVNKNKLENLNQVQEFIRSGGKPSALQSPSIPIPGGPTVPATDQDKVQVPGMGQVPISSFQTPEEHFNQLRQQFSAQAGGTTAGQLRAQLDAAPEFDARTRAEKLYEHQLEMEKVRAQGANNVETAKIHGSYQLAGDRINGENHIAGIREMHRLGLDDGTGSTSSVAKQLVDGIFDGTHEYSKLSPDEKRLVDGYTAGTGELGALPTDTKSYQKKLETVSGLQSLVNQYRDLANNYSVDSEGSLGKGNAHIATGIPIIGTRGFVTPGSDLASKLDSMKSTGGQLASYFDQQNRKSDAEILRQVKGWFDPAATKEQNIQKINDHVQQLQQGVKTTFGAMKPERVNKVLGDKGITDFGAFGVPKASGPQHIYFDSKGNPIQQTQGNQ